MLHCPAFAKHCSVVTSRYLLGILHHTLSNLSELKKCSVRGESPRVLSAIK